MTRKAPAKKTTPQKEAAPLFVIRPLSSSDAPALAHMFDVMPSQEKRWRFFNTFHELPDSLSALLLRHEPGSMWALGAFDPQGVLLGVGHAACVPGACTAEFAIAVPAPYGHRGIGRALIADLKRELQHVGVLHWNATVAEDNTRMKEFCRQQGFTLRHSEDPGVVRAEGLLSFSPSPLSSQSVAAKSERIKNRPQTKRDCDQNFVS